MIQTSRSILMAIAIFSLAGSASAQIVNEDASNLVFYTAQEFLPVAGGVPFSDVRYVEAQGSAYYNYEWEKGTVITTNGQAYKGVPVKIDLVAQKIHYKGLDDRDFLIATPVREVRYQDGDKLVRFLNGEFLPNKKQGWYQLLVNDSLSLVRSFKKTFEERITYGTTSWSIRTAENYFIFINGTERPIKKPSDLIEILPGKKDEIEAEIKRLKSSSKDDQFIGITKFVNSLLKG